MNSKLQDYVIMPDGACGLHPVSFLIPARSAREALLAAETALGRSLIATVAGARIPPTIVTLRKYYGVVMAEAKWGE